MNISNHGTRCLTWTDIRTISTAVWRLLLLVAYGDWTSERIPNESAKLYYERRYRGILQVVFFSIGWMGKPHPQSPNGLYPRLLCLPPLNPYLIIPPRRKPTPRTRIHHYLTLPPPLGGPKPPSPSPQPPSQKRHPSTQWPYSITYPGVRHLSRTSTVGP